MTHEPKPLRTVFSTMGWMLAIFLGLLSVCLWNGYLLPIKYAAAIALDEETKVANKGGR